MSALSVAALAAGLTAGAAFSTVHALRSGRPTVAAARARLYDPPRASGSDRPLLQPLAARIEGADHLGLRLVGVDAHALALRLVVAFIAGAFLVALAVGTLVTLDALPESPVWAVAAPAVGAAAAWTLWGDVRQKITRRRRDVQRAVNDFVQLVAVGLTTDQSVDEAVRFALAVADDETFVLLRSELETAPLRGVPLWDALDGLGQQYGQRELCELASSIERQGTQGVAITETVGTIAAAMRAKALDALEREADRVNARLAGPTTAFVLTVVVFLAYPLAIRITEAFGG